MEIRQHGMVAQQMQTQANGIPPLTPLKGLNQAPAAQMPAGAPPMPMNPYTKTPMLSRRRRFPSFY
jgi:hypothetical protein